MKEMTKGLIIGLVLSIILAASGLVIGYDAGHQDGYSVGYNRGSLLGCEVGCKVTANLYEGLANCRKKYCDCPDWDSWAAFTDDCMEYEDVRNYFANNHEAREIYTRYERIKNLYPTTCKSITITMPNE